MCESTGTPPQFPSFVRSMESLGFRVVMVHMSAPLDCCFDRIASRDTAGHLPASEELVGRIYVASMALLNDGIDARLPPFVGLLSSETKDVNECAEFCIAAIDGLSVGQCL